MFQLQAKTEAYTQEALGSSAMGCLPDPAPECDDEGTKVVMVGGLGVVKPIFFRTIDVPPILRLTPLVSSQDPMLEPAWITEGIVPLWMSHDDFFVCGNSWAKFHGVNPWISLMSCGPLGCAHMIDETMRRRVFLKSFSVT